MMKTSRFCARRVFCTWWMEPTIYLEWSQKVTRSYLELKHRVASQYRSQTWNFGNAEFQSVWRMGILQNWSYKSEMDTINVDISYRVFRCWSGEWCAPFGFFMWPRTRKKWGELPPELVSAKDEILLKSGIKNSRYIWHLSAPVRIGWVISRNSENHNKMRFQTRYLWKNVSSDNVNLLKSFRRTWGRPRRW